MFNRLAFVLAALLCFAQPLVGQTTEIRVQVTQRDTVELRLIVVSAFAIATDSTDLPTSVEMVAYTFQLLVVNLPSNQTVLWSLDSGSLPPGLTLDPITGIISGTAPAGSMGRYEFVIRATTVDLPGGNLDE